MSTSIADTLGSSTIDAGITPAEIVESPSETTSVADVVENVTTKGGSALVVVFILWLLFRKKRRKKY